MRALADLARSRGRFVEDDEQAMVIQWAAHVRTDFGMLSTHLIAIPNGAHLAGDEKKRGAQMARLKRVGLRKGAADLFLALPRGRWHGLFIEMKKPRALFRTDARARAAVSVEQREFGEDAMRAGYMYVVAYGFDQAKTIIEHYLASSREVVVRADEGEFC